MLREHVIMPMNGGDPVASYDDEHLAVTLAAKINNMAGAVIVRVVGVERNAPFSESRAPGRVADLMAAALRPSPVPAAWRG